MNQNNYINTIDMCGNNISVLDVDINYDIYNDFDIVKYSINHTSDISGCLYYSIDKIDCMTNNFVAETMDIHNVNCITGINLNVATETEYLTYNRNVMASSLFNMDCAGNVIFYFADEFLNETEKRTAIKEIKNYAIHTGLIKAIDIHI